MSGVWKIDVERGLGKPIIMVGDTDIPLSNFDNNWREISKEEVSIAFNHSPSH